MWEFGREKGGILSALNYSWDILFIKSKEQATVVQYLLSFSQLQQKKKKEKENSEEEQNTGLKRALATEILVIPMSH